MSNYEKTYKKALRHVLDNGRSIETRTGVDAKTCFGINFDINMWDGFPIITGKKVDFNKAFGEFSWMFAGKTDLRSIKEYGIDWWDDFADVAGNLGRTYGYQIRHFNKSYTNNDGFDQVAHVIRELKLESRRAIITFYNPTDIKYQTLPPCYTTMTFVRIGNDLNMQMNLRSSDMFLGLPYDIIIGALFLITIARQLQLCAHTLQMSLVNAHIYENHVNAVNRYLNLPHGDYLPLILDDYTLTPFESGPYIPAKLNV